MSFRVSRSIEGELVVELTFDAARRDQRARNCQSRRLIGFTTAS
jgi:hypothetical protein